jgi:GNAT superfamily N-acetyltransferase
MPPRKRAIQPVPQPTSLDQLFLRPWSAADRGACQQIAGSSTDYAHAIDANADAIEVAVLDNLVVGFAYIQVWNWNRVAWLGEMVIDRDYRGRGVGRALLRRMEDRARELGCRVIMDHPPASHPAINYYLKNGYRVCGYNDRFYSDSKETTAIFVCKELQ